MVLMSLMVALEQLQVWLGVVNEILSVDEIKDDYDVGTPKHNALVQKRHITPVLGGI